VSGVLQGWLCYWPVRVVPGLFVHGSGRCLLELLEFSIVVGVVFPGALFAFPKFLFFGGGLTSPWHLLWLFLGGCANCVNACVIRAEFAFKAVGTHGHLMICQHSMSMLSVASGFCSHAPSNRSWCDSRISKKSLQWSWSSHMVCTNQLGWPQIFSPNARCLLCCHMH